MRSSMSRRTPLALALLAVVDPALALRLPPPSRVVREAQKTLVTAACAATLALGGGEAALAAPSLRDAIVETSEATYPILKALPSDTFPAFADKIGSLFLGVKPDKLAKIIEIDLDVLLSVPPEKVTAFNGVVKDAFDGLKPDGGCDLVPLPPPSLVERFTSSEALAQVDAAKLKAFDELWGPALKALAKTPTAICLPPPAKLDALALAQAEIGKSFGADEVKALDKAGTILKSAITPAKAFPLIGDAQKQTMGASLPERQRFKAAGAQVETAAKLCTALPRKAECAL